MSQILKPNKNFCISALPSVRRSLNTSNHKIKEFSKKSHLTISIKFINSSFSNIFKFEWHMQLFNINKVTKENSSSSVFFLFISLYLGSDSLYYI